MSDLINANPTVQTADSLPQREKTASVALSASEETFSYLQGLQSSLTLSSSEKSVENTIEQVDQQEIYDLIASISDPEHPLTLGQLSVVNLQDITVEQPNIPSSKGLIKVQITPTITHCSLATLIGLGIRVRLQRSVSELFMLDIKVKPGTHQSENQVNKQLNDKERVAAACENPQLVNVVGKMLLTCKEF